MAQMQQKTSHDEWHEPESPNNILLIWLAVELNIGHIVKRNQVENDRNDAGDSKPAGGARTTTEREQPGHCKANQHIPFVEQP
jgi:hypothetical protein